MKISYPYFVNYEKYYLSLLKRVITPHHKKNDSMYVIKLCDIFID